MLREPRKGEPTSSNITRPGVGQADLLQLQQEVRRELQRLGRLGLIKQLTNEAGDVYIQTYDDGPWADEPFDVASLSAHRLGFHARAYASATESVRKHGSVSIFGVVSIERQEPKHDGDPIELVIETKAGSVRLFLFEAADRPVER